MATLSPQILARARKNASAIVNALANVSQVKVAELMGVHESTISKMKEVELDRMGAFLAACGLKAVPEDACAVDPKVLSALGALAALGAQRAGEPSGFGDLA